MRPQTIDIVSELPRTATGKRDGSTTPTATSPDAANDTPPCEAPCLHEARWTEEDQHWTRLVWRVARAFAVSLELRQIEVKLDSDFFALGGDSLSTSSLLVQIENDHGISLSVVDFLKTATPEGVADLVSRINVE